MKFTKKEKKKLRKLFANADVEVIHNLQLMQERINLEYTKLFAENMCKGLCVVQVMKRCIDSLSNNVEDA